MASRRSKGPATTQDIVEKRNQRVKIISLGDSKTGKSCLIKFVCVATSVVVCVQCLLVVSVLDPIYLTGALCLACLRRFCEDKFVNKYLRTIGVDFGVKPVKIDGRSVKVNFWDLSGHDEFFQVHEPPLNNLHWRSRVRFVRHWNVFLLLQ
eukprot:INCI2697.3.p1 GENE.INCI2697.3~~INCI2697.3.p1  ORF type:complete len:151 (+),score=24.51 INCI2697.3:208-660(+)